MDVSLSIYARSLASEYGEGFDNFISLQRGLVESGLVKPDRPGPGGGIRATPETVAKLLVAWLCCPGRVKVAQEGPRWWTMGRARGDRGKPAPLFKATTFGELIETALAQPALAMRIERIEVDRKSGVARVVYFDTPDCEATAVLHFSQSAERGAGHRSGIYELAVVSGLVLADIARELSDDE